MATLAELLRDRAVVPSPVVEHLQRLVGSWGILSDLSFSDLLLFVPAAGAPGGFVVVGQVRPTTSQTLHLEDLLGRQVTDHDRPLLSRAFALGSVVEGELPVLSRGEKARVVCIPVRCQGQVVAVLTREAPLVVGRRPGELERVYVSVFDRLARMVAAGSFPFPVDEPLSTEAPRVGDGVMTLDDAGRVEFASPNAVNAMHRLGIYRGVLGASMEELGLGQAPVSDALSAKAPVSDELEVGDVAVFMRCIPMLDQNGGLGGALLLVRDVTDLRQRDRMLLTKDVAIREVHHRVKNNLQTISSLLSLQSRRMAPGEARHALQEAERRVRSIAVVHEILSRDTNDQVDFNDILPSLARMAADLSGAEPVEVTWSGEAGELSAQVATPLAVALNELLQNAVEHAFTLAQEKGQGFAPRVHMAFERQGDELRAQVRDNGDGLPEAFSIDGATSLGLSIVRGLVNSQLGGKITMYNDNGTVAELVVPVRRDAENDLSRI